MDKSDKYWSCSDKESLCLRGDSNLLFVLSYLLLLTLLTYCVYSDITVGRSLHMATHMNGNLICNLSSSWQLKLKYY